jgi:hypothetical protein
MPPQQAYGLPDFVDDILRFRAHGDCFFLLVSRPKAAVESARNIGMRPLPVKQNGQAPSALPTSLATARIA